MENNKEMPKVDLYSDGGARPNPGKGGYGLKLTCEKDFKEFSQGYVLTTNNRMELLGVISGLEKLKTKSCVNVYTDSKYVIDAIEKGWAKKWKSNNWIRTKNKKAINADLWSRLLDLVSKHDVKFNWVKGHSGDTNNERCDFLATEALKSKNLIIDEGYNIVENLSRSEKKQKVTKEGDRCKSCNTPVIKRISKKKKIKLNQRYYYEFFLYCNECKKMYMIEEWKRYVDSGSYPIASPSATKPFNSTLPKP